MNKRYVSEIRLILGNVAAIRRWILLSVFLSALFPSHLNNYTYALPTGAEVQEGSASIETPDASTLNITVSNQAVIQWQSFNILANETVNFYQPLISSSVLNRVIAGGPSEIAGALNANGSVILVNPAGINFASSAQVNVGSLIASSLNISNQDFMIGNYAFQKVDGLQAGMIINEGYITTVRPGGLVAMLGGVVENHGTIVAELGTVALASGNRMTLRFDPKGMVQADVTEGIAPADVQDGRVPLNHALLNAGGIHADGGTVILNANQVSRVFEKLVNSTGYIEAATVANQGGRIELLGASGTVAVSGSLSAVGSEANSIGGNIKVLGGEVQLLGAKINASGSTGGGTVLIGGNFQGNGPEINAVHTYVSPDTEIKVDAISEGRGGEIIVWADDVTLYYGNIFARGGVLGGDGGFVEVSGKNNLSFRGTADLSSALGETGTLLLDPATITITGGGVPTTFAGTPSGTTGTIIFSDTGPTTVFESEIEGVAANIVLQATGTINVSGAFTGGVTPGANRNITLQTRNNTGEGIGGIDLSGGTGFSITTSGTGTITIQSGTGGTETGNAPIILSALTSANGAIAVTAEGTLTVGGAITTGNTTTSGTPSRNITLTSTNLDVIINADVSTGTASVADAGGGQTAVSGNITVSAGTSVTGTGRLITGTAAITGAGSGGTDSATSGNISVTAGTAGTTGGIGLSNANAVTIGTAQRTGGGAGGDTANAGTITFTSDVEINNGTTSTAMGITVGLASGAGTNNLGSLNVTTSQSTGHVFVTSSTALQLGTLATTAGTSQTLNISTTGTSDLTLLNVAETLSGDNVTLSTATGTSILTIANASFTIGAGTLTITADEIDFTGGGNSITGTGTLTIQPAAAGVSIGVGGGAGTLDVSDTDLAAITNGWASNVVGRSDGTALMTISSSTFRDPVTLRMPGVSGDITITGGALTTAAQNEPITIIAGTGDTGTFTQTAGAGNTIASGTGAIIITADSIVLNTTANTITGTGTITLRPATTSRPIVVGAAGAATDFALSTAEVAAITNGFSGITIGDTTAGTGSVTISATTFNDNLTLVGGSIASNGLITNTGNTVTMTARVTDITDGNGATGNITAATANLTAVTGIGSADALETTITTLTFSNTTSGNVQVTDAGTLALSGTNAGGDLTIITTGAITQPALISVSGTSSFTAGASAITLANGSNDFTGAVSISNSGANAVSITDIDDIVLGTVSVGTGTLAVTAVGITQTGTITQTAGAGTATFNAGTGVITLANANDFTGAVSLNNSGANDISVTDTNAIILGTSAVGTGTLTINAVGITQSGVTTITQTAAAGAATFNGGAGVITLGSANNFTGAVSLNNSGANNVLVTDANAIILGTSNVGTGTLTVNAVGITQTGAITQTAVAGAATFNAGAGVITLTQSNDFTGAVSLNNSGANNVSVTDANAIILGTSGVGTGTFTVNAVGITQSGAITQTAAAGAATFNAGAGVITLSSANNFTGAVSLNNSGANDVSVTDSNAIILGTSAVGTGTFTITAVGITQSGVTTITQTAGAGAATFNGGAGVITLGSANDFTGAVSLNNSGANNVSVTDTNAIILGTSGVGTGTFTVNAVGITQSGAITQTAAAGAATFNGGTGVITLTQSNDFTGAVSLNNSGPNDVSVTDTNAIILGTSGVGTGTFTVNAVGITQSGAITQTAAAGAATFNGGAGVITLGSANDFTGVVSLNNSGANDVSVTDTNAIILGTSGVGTGTLTVNAVGITQSGAITQSAAAGTATFNGGAGVITLGLANDFTGAVSLNNSGANAVSITDTNALALGTSSVGQNLSITAGGAISQTGILTVPGTTTISVTAGAADILLDTQANNFTGTITFSGTLSNIRDVSVRNVNAAATIPSLTGLTNLRNLTLVFDNSAVSLPATTLASGGNLSITAGGAITQSGALVVPGTSSFTTGSFLVDLTQSNDFTGAVSIANSGANAVSITDTNALILGTLSIGQDLSVTAGGALTQTSTLTVPGTTTISATAGATDILLDTQANNFTGTISFAGTQSNIRDVALRNVNASATVPTLSGLTNLRNLTITFNNAAVALPAATLTSGGNLTVTAGGAISQAGALVVPGTSSFTTGAFTITLANGSNDFTGAVSLNNSGANDVSIFDSTAINIGASTLGGGIFTVTAADITISGAVNNGSGAVILKPSTAGSTIGVEDASKNFNLTDAELDFITTTGLITIGVSTNTGGITIGTDGALTQGSKSFDFVTGGSIAVGGNNFTTTGNTTFTADADANATGSITAGAGVILANVLSASAAQGIAMNTNVTSITASNTTSGNVVLSEANGVTLTSVTNVGGGNISVTTTTGNLTITTVNANSGDVTLTASAGDLLSSTSSITGNILTLNAGGADGDVGVTGTPLNTTASSINASATGSGEIVITEFNGASLPSVTTAGGQITVVSTSGNLSIGTINAVGGSVTLTATAGSILDATSSVTGGTLSFTAGAAAGSVGISGTSINTAGSTLNLTTGSGGAFINNTGNVSLNAPTIGAGGSISVVSSGALSLPASAITLSGSGAINFVSNGGNLATNGALTTVSGNLTLSASNNLTVGDNLVTGSGSMNLTGDNDTSGAGNFVQSAGITIISTSGNITITGAGTTSVRDISTGGAGIIDIASTGGAVNQLAGTTIQTAGGNIIVNAGGGNATLEIVNAGSGNLNVTASGAGNDILRQSAGSLWTGNVITLTANNTNGNVGTNANPINTTAATLNAAAQAGGIFINETNGVIISGLSTTAGNGDINLTAGGSVNVTGAISANGSGVVTLTAFDLAIPGSISSGTGAVNLIPSTAVETIGIEDAAKDFNLTDSDLDNITTTGLVTIGSTTNTGGITIGTDGALTQGAKNFAFVTGAGIAISGNNFTTTGNVTLTADADLNASGDIVSGAGIVAGNLLTLNSAQGITLNTDATSLSATNSTSGNIVITEANGIDITGASTSAGGGSISVVTTNGSITTSGAISANGTGTVTLTANGASNTITLNSSISSGSGAVSLTAANGISLVGGGADVTTTGTYTVNADSDASGAGTYSQTAAGSAVSSGTVLITAADINLVGSIDAGAASITLRPSTAGSTIGVEDASKNFNLDDGELDDITTTGLITVGVSTNTGGITIGTDANLTQGAKNFAFVTDGSISVSGNDFTTTGNVTMTTAGGAISSGAGIVAANLLTASAANGIALNTNVTSLNLTNTASGNITIVETNGVDLTGVSQSVGNFNLTANGAITDSGAIVVSGTATFAAGAANNITLNNANNFSTVLITSGNDVTLSDINAIVLGASTVSGNYNVTAGASITNSGALLITGSSSFTVPDTFSISVNNAGNAFTGTLTFTASSGTIANVTVVDTTAVDLEALTLTGNLNVTAGGDITDSGELVIAGTATFAAGVNNITLNNANNFSTVLITSGNDVTLNDINALILGASTVSGILSVTTSGAITQSGALAVTGTSSFTAGANSIDLTNGSNDFTGAVSLNNSGVNNVAVTDANAIVIGTSNVGSGTWTVNAAGITQTGAITQAAGAGDATFNAGAGVITLTQSNDFTGAVSLNNSGANSVAVTDLNALILGSSNVGTGTFVVNAGGHITQTGAIVQAASAGTSTFTVSAAGSDILLSGFANNFSGAANFTDNGNIRDLAFRNINTGATVPTLPSAIRDLTLIFDNAAMAIPAVTVTGNFTATAGGNITQTGAIVVPGTSTFNSGAANDITLDNSANDFATALITAANNVSLRDTNAIDLGASTISGTLLVTSSGAISDSGALVVTGTATFAAGAANNITLNNANNFSTVVITSGNDVTLNDINAIDLGVSTVSGILSVTASGTITDSGALTVTGTATFAGGAANDITLNNANNFSTIIITSGNNVILNDINAVDLGASTISGTLNWSAGGPITDSGALVVTGTATFAAGAANNITLNDANNFSTVVITSGNDVILNDINALDLGASTVSGTLNVTTSGAISDSGALVVTGAATFAAGAANNIILNNANNFSTVVITSGNDVTLVDTNAIVMGTSTVSGNLDITAGGTISQTGALVVTGTSTFTLPGGNDVTLANPGNNFGGAVSFVSSGGGNLNNITIVDTTAFDLGTLTIDGTLNVTAGGAITDSGAIVAAGTATFEAGAANDITLNNANNFSTIIITSGNNVLINDINALDLGVSTISGTLNVTTSGTITDSGALAVTGTATFAAGAANNITLNNANNFSTVMISTGNNVTLNDINSIILGASTVSGTLNVTTSGSITDSGNLVVTGTATFAAGAANDIILNSSGNNFSTVFTTTGNNVTVVDSNAIAFEGGTISGNLTVTANGAITNSASMTVSGTATFTAGAANNITLNGVSGFATFRVISGNNVAVYDLNGIDLGASTISGTLDVTASGDVTNSGALLVTGTTTFFVTAAANITLNNAGNDFSTVVDTSGNTSLTINDINGLDLGSINTGTLSVTTNGAITDSGAIQVGGTSTFAAGAANDITLNSGGNNFSTVVITSGNNVTLVDSNAIILGASTISGTLSVTASGTITDSGNLSVTGIATFAAGAANDITLNNSNNFSTVIITSGNNVTIVDANAIILGASTVSGNYNVTAGSHISQSGVLTITGTAAFTLTSANSDLLLDTQANNFSGTVTATDNGNVRDLQLRNVNATAAVPSLPANLRDLTLIFNNAAITIPAVTLTGNMAITAGGAITDSGALIVAGTATFTAGAANNITLNNANNFSTVLVVSGNNVTLNDINALDLGASTISGTLNATTSGAITDSGNLSVTGTATFAAGAANDITLNSSGNNFSTVFTTTGNNVTVVDSNAIAFEGGTISGNLTVTANGAITNSASMTVSGTATFEAGAANNITLNGVSGFATFRVISGNNVAVYDLNGIDLGASTISGTLDVTASGNVTDSGALAVTGTTTFFVAAADNITLDNAGNDFSTVANTSGNASMTIVDSNAINLGAITVGTLSVTANGAITDSSVLVLSGTATFAAGSANDITLNTLTNNFSSIVITSGNNVTLVDFNGIDLGASTVSGTLNVTGSGAITDSGNLSVTGTATFAAGAANDITLNNANNFSTVIITSGNNVTLNDTNALILGASTVSGTLSVTTSGTITDSGNLSVTGTATLAAGAANNITLNNANNFSTVVITSGNDVTLVDVNAIAMGTSTVSGNLDITAGGTISQTGALAVSGASTFTLPGGNNVNLNNSGNNFTGAVSFVSSGGGNLNNITVVDSSALDLGALTIDGNLGVTSGASITQSGAVVIAGTSTFTLPGGSSITLNNAGNDFGGAVSFVSSGGGNLNNVTVVDTTAFDIAALTINGALSVTAGGAITDSGALIVAGTATFTAGAANNITLNNANNFSTVLVVSGNNVTLNDINALDLGASTISGTLSVTTSGAITDSGNLSVTGTATFAAGAANNITLDQSGNNFSTVLITSGNNVTIIDTNAIVIGGTTVSGDLTVTANGAITDFMSFTVAGTTTFTAGAGNNITLDGVNDFATFHVISGNNVTVSDSNGIDLGASTISGTFDVTASGNVTDSGALVVSGTTTFFVTAGAAITLDNAGNDFSTVANTSGNASMTIVDSNAINLGAITVGTLSVTANGAITDSSVLVLSGTATFAAGSANDITLNTLTNNFSSIVITSGNNVTLVDFNGIDLGASTVSGTLNVTGSGTITDSGNLSVTGTATFASGAANNITLNNANNFSTVSITSGNNVTLNDVNALDLGASTVNGLFSVTTSGAITDSGAIVVTGTATFASGAANNITLNNANNFSTVVITSGKDVTLVDTNAIGLGASTVSGVFNVTSGGSIIQSGALVVTGASTFTAGAGGNITLTNASNDFSSITASTSLAGQISITDSNGASLPSITTAGGLILLISVSGDFSVGTVNAGAGDVTLTASSGDLLSSGSLVTGNNVTLTAGGADGDISLNTAANALTATATGTGEISISQSGAVTVTSLTTAGGNIVFSASGNATVNTMNAGTGAITLTTTAGGSVLDGNGGANNLTAGANSSISASGTIGTSVTALDVAITGATLTVGAGGIDSGVSININGTVTPSNTLNVPAFPTGLVLFNGTPITPPAPPAPGTGTDGSVLSGIFNPLNSFINWFGAEDENEGDPFTNKKGWSLQDRLRFLD